MDIYVGIDPDREKNGVARLNPQTRQLDIFTMDFAETLEYVYNQNRQCQSVGNRLLVIIEAGWLNKSNWHVYPGMSVYQCAAIGASLGANQETGKKLIELFNHWHVYNKPVKPLALTFRVGRRSMSKWSGKDGKISHEDLERFTGYNKRNNQEGRDAALLAWEYARLPVRYCFAK